MEIGGSLRPLVSEAVLKRFERPDEVRDMTLGRFEVVRLGGMVIGRATCPPGWRWSKHVGRKLGQERCQIEQLGLVIAGAAAAGFPNGRINVMRAGDLFYIAPEPHDSWVVGDQLYVSLHFLGTDRYAK
jgi:hypothetical protein